MDWKLEREAAVGGVDMGLLVRGGADSREDDD